MKEVCFSWCVIGGPCVAVFGSGVCTWQREATFSSARAIGCSVKVA